MEYTTLGRTGRRVSRLGFGGATAGLKNYLEVFDPENDEQRSGVIAAIHRALALGVTYFDTAPGYGAGASEIMFGEALAGVNDEIFLATKVPRQANRVRQSIEESLRRLRRDCVDLVQIHGSSYSPELAGELLEAGGMVDQLEALRDEGLINYIGFTSEDSNSAVYRFIESDRFDVMQICYNFIYQHPYEPSRPFGSILEADRANLGVVTMRTMTSGILQTWMDMVNPNNTFDYSPALLQFVLSNEKVDVALVGMRDAAIVEQNVAIVADSAGRISLDQLHKRYVD
ncbi:MAG: aldo/keto reductase [bacterium]|nr:aldo/keto reductase [bacterium]